MQVNLYMFLLEKLRLCITHFTFKIIKIFEQVKISGYIYIVCTACVAVYTRYSKIYFNYVLFIKLLEFNYIGRFPTGLTKKLFGFFLTLKNLTKSHRKQNS